MRISETEKEKLLQLLKSQDFGIVQQGLMLLRSLGEADPTVFKQVLGIPKEEYVSVGPQFERPDFCGYWWTPKGFEWEHSWRGYVGGWVMGELVRLGVMKPSAVQRMHLGGMKLALLPDNLGALSDLKELDLTYSSFSSFSSDASACVPAQISPLIFQLRMLEVLDLKANQLSSLPDEIALLTRLKRLVLDFNPLASLPDTIGTLEKLEYLSINVRGELQIPDSFSALKNLKNLSLGGIETLPIGVRSMRKIEHLHCFSTLKELPEWILELRFLRSLDLYKIPAKDPCSVLEKMQSVQYLRLPIGKKHEWGWLAQKLPQCKILFFL